MMRCLGIPARSVTNYDSAHDSEGNCTDDKYFDEELNYIDEESEDSVWNFHVWNDVWMARPDLPPGMGGWQAIDGTPQEESTGIYRCGPAPLQAVKEGNVYLGYDTKFVFAEVNADTVYWQHLPNGDLKPFRVKTNSVGSAILTKKPNGYSAEDISNQYKYKEGSLLERATVRRVMKKVRNPVLEKQPTDITFTTRVPWNVDTEEELGVRMTAINKKSHTFTINTVVVAHVVRYNGVKVKCLERRTEEQQVSSMEDVEFKFIYNMSEFAEFMDENVSIRFSLTAKVKESGQMYATQKICNIQKPQLHVQILDNETGEFTDGDTMTVQVTVPKIGGIDNYSNAVLSIETGVMLDNETFQLDEDETSAGCFEKSFTAYHYHPKDKDCNFNFVFNADEISGIEGTVKAKYISSSRNY